jgi:hypothetical protein
MSVRPVTFQANGDIDVVYDELGHSGTIPAAQVQWATQIDGSHNHNFIVLNCPDGCGATSTWPVGGGADAVNGQQLFVHKTELAGCACGQVEAGRTDAVPESHVRLNCNRMDGPGRWQVDQALGREAPTPFDPSKSFQVIYQETDGLVVGLEPAGGVGPDLKVAVLHDMAEYDNLVRYDPAYVTLPDKDHIVGTPQTP